MSGASMPELLRLFAAKAEEWCNATDTEDAWRIECEAVEAFREAFATAAQSGQRPQSDAGARISGGKCESGRWTPLDQCAEERECRHCGWMCRPNDTPSKKWHPLEQGGQQATQQQENKK